MCFENSILKISIVEHQSTRASKSCVLSLILTVMSGQTGCNNYTKCEDISMFLSLKQGLFTKKIPPDHKILEKGTVWFNKPKYFLLVLSARPLLFLQLVSECVLI